MNIDEMQFELMSSRGTSDVILILRQQQENTSPRILYFDLEKAFDRVLRSHLKRFESQCVVCGKNSLNDSRKFPSEVCGKSVESNSIFYLGILCSKIDGILVPDPTFRCNW